MNDAVASSAGSGTTPNLSAKSSPAVVSRFARSQGPETNEPSLPSMKFCTFSSSTSTCGASPSRMNEE